MDAEEIEIPFDGGGVESLTGLWQKPRRPRESAILLAHGAGADMRSEFMTEVAAGLVGAGFRVLRFDYAYTERARREGKRRPPDRRPTLEAAHRAALGALRRRVRRGRVLLAGKSMGGRMGSYLAADGEDVAGLVFFGYPLHPPGKPDRPRSDHFPRIAQPALFLQGGRDALCDLDLLRGALREFGGEARVEVFEEADHGFGVRKRSGLNPEGVRAGLVEAVDRWDAETFGQA